MQYRQEEAILRNKQRKIEILETKFNKFSERLREGKKKKGIGIAPIPYIVSPFYGILT